MPFRYWIFLLALLPLSGFAQPLGKITFTEGRVRVIRDSGLMLGVQGLVVESGDIVETTQPGFALIELAEGAVFALGEATRVMVSQTPSAATEVMLLEGWVKAQSNMAETTKGFGLLSPTQSVGGKTANLVMHSTAGFSEVFVESGAVSLGVTDKRGRPSGMAAAKAGQFVTRATDKLPLSQLRVNDAFLSKMPSAFKDALPSRLERLKDRTVETKSAGLVSYVDVADWLTTQASWRAGFVKRFESRLADPAFKQQVQAHIKSLPDWGPVLNPNPPVIKSNQ